MLKNKLIFYDIEIYNNLFILSSVTTTINLNTFELDNDLNYNHFILYPSYISPNQIKNTKIKGKISTSLKKLKDFINNIYNSNLCLAGYNIIHFDNVILDKFYNDLFNVDNKDAIIRTLKNVANRIIDKKENISFFNRRHCLLYNKIIFDYLAIRKDKPALKDLAYILKKDAKETPFDFNSDIKVENISKCIEYCQNDIDIYIELFKQVKGEFYSRYFLFNYVKDNFNIKIDNINKILNGQAPTIAQIVYSKYLNLYKPDNNIVLRREKRELIRWVKSKIDLSLFPSFLKSKLEKIYNDNSIYNYPIQKSANSIFKDYFNTNEFYLALGHNNLLVKIASGGIHSYNPYFYISNTEYTLFYIDASSYYPHLMLNIGAVPSWFNSQQKKQFLNLIRILLKKRLEIKGLQRKAKNEGNKEKAKYYKTFSNSLKLLLNSTYGLLGEAYNIRFKDTFSMLQIAVSGELLLVDLILKLYNKFNTNIKVIHANTDGIIVCIKNNKIEYLKNFIKEKEENYNIPFDIDKLDYCLIKDANNYIAGKLKGAYRKASLSNPNLNPQIIPNTIQNFLNKLKDELKDISNIEEHLFLNPYLVYDLLANIFKEELEKSIKYNDILSFIYSKKITTERYNKGISICFYENNQIKAELGKKAVFYKTIKNNINIKQFNKVTNKDSGLLQLGNNAYPIINNKINYKILDKEYYFKEIIKIITPPISYTITEYLKSLIPYNFLAIFEGGEFKKNASGSFKFVDNKEFPIYISHTSQGGIRIKSLNFLIIDVDNKDLLKEYLPDFYKTLENYKKEGLLIESNNNNNYKVIFLAPSKFSGFKFNKELVKNENIKITDDKIIDKKTNNIIIEIITPKYYKVSEVKCRSAHIYGAKELKDLNFSYYIPKTCYLKKTPKELLKYININNLPYNPTTDLKYYNMLKENNLEKLKEQKIIRFELYFNFIKQNINNIIKELDVYKAKKERKKEYKKNLKDAIEDKGNYIIVDANINTKDKELLAACMTLKNTDNIEGLEEHIGANYNPNVFLFLATGLKVVKKYPNNKYFSEEDLINICFKACNTPRWIQPKSEKSNAIRNEVQLYNKILEKIKQLKEELEDIRKDETYIIWLAKLIDEPLFFENYSRILSREPIVKLKDLPYKVISVDDINLNSSFCLIGETGSGKTYALAKAFIKYLLTKEQPKQLIYTALNHTLLTTFKNYLIEIYKKETDRDLEEDFKLLYLEQNNQPQNSDYEEAHIILAPFVYFQFKPFSIENYKLMKFIVNNHQNIKCVVFDEYDDIINHCNSYIILKDRYFPYTNKRINNQICYNLINKCPLSQTLTACKNCKEFYKTKLILDNNSCLKLETDKTLLIGNNKINEEHLQKDIINLLETEFLEENKYIIDNMEIIQYINKAKENVLEEIINKMKEDKEEKENEEQEVKDTDLLKYLKTCDLRVIREFIYNKREEKEIKIIFREEDKKEDINVLYLLPEELKEIKRKDLLLPYSSCEKRLTFINLACFELLAMLEIPQIYLTATLSNSDFEVASSIVKNINLFKIENERKLNNCLLLFLNNKNSLIKIENKKNISRYNELKEFNILHFEPYKERLDILKNRLKSHNIKLQHNYSYQLDPSWKALKNDTFKQTAKEVFLNYSYGATGRGANLNKFDIVVVPSYLFKPRFSYSNIKDKKELIYKRAEEQASLILQNLGRITRGEKEDNKVIIIEGFLNIDIKSYIYSHIKKRFNNIKVFQLKEFNNKVIEIIKDFFNNKDLKENIEIKEDIKKAKELLNKPNDNISKTERELKEKIYCNKDDLKILKKLENEDKQKEIKEKIKELKKKSKKWSEIYRKLHLNRLNKQERERLKEYYKTI